MSQKKSLKTIHLILIATLITALIWLLVALANPGSAAFIGYALILIFIIFLVVFIRTAIVDIKNENKLASQNINSFNSKIISDKEFYIIQGLSNLIWIPIYLAVAISIIEDSAVIFMLILFFPLVILFILLAIGINVFLIKRRNSNKNVTIPAYFFMIAGILSAILIINMIN